MSYFWYIIIFSIVYYILNKLLGSIIKGCLTTILFILIALVVVVMVKSTKEPVNIFNLYEVNNFNVRKL